MKPMTESRAKEIIKKCSSIKTCTEVEAFGYGFMHARSEGFLEGVQAERERCVEILKKFGDENGPYYESRGLLIEEILKGE